MKFKVSIFSEIENGKPGISELVGEFADYREARKVAQKAARDCGYEVSCWSNDGTLLVRAGQNYGVAFIEMVYTGEAAERDRKAEEVFNSAMEHVKAIKSLYKPYWAEFDFEINNQFNNMELAVYELDSCARPQWEVDVEHPSWKELEPEDSE